MTKEITGGLYPPYDDAIMSTGYTKQVMSCGRGIQEPHVGYTHPREKRKDLIEMIKSHKEWVEEFRVSRCEAQGGCSEDCQFKVYLETPAEVIADVLLGNNGLPKPSRIKKLLGRIGL